MNATSQGSSSQATGIAFPGVAIEDAADVDAKPWNTAQLQLFWSFWRQCPIEAIGPSLETWKPAD
ncbi:MAG: hypothetical protein C1943_04895 [Halochromatium sp.]|nr:hypothetical protein [Halochromatium sp.]